MSTVTQTFTITFNRKLYEFLWICSEEIIHFISKISETVQQFPCCIFKRLCLFLGIITKSICQYSIEKKRNKLQKIVNYVYSLLIFNISDINTYMKTLYSECPIRKGYYFR